MSAVQDTPENMTGNNDNNMNDTAKDESTLTPWEVKGKINYMAQIEKFGTNPIDGSLIKRWEQVTKMKAHRFIRRGIVFSNQDINRVLDCVEKGIPIYIYTGRGPSSESMHIGHLVPFILTRYLQEALNCIVVIQMSDDEKFLFKDGTKPKDLEYYHNLSYKNAKDIMACGFEKDKTLIFSNLESNRGYLYFNNVLIMKSTNMNQIKSTYGLGETLPPKVLAVLNEHMELLKKQTPNDEVSSTIREIEATTKKYTGDSAASVGQCAWPAFQCGPAFPTSFTEVFIKSIKSALQNKNMPEEVAKNMKRVLGQLLGARTQKATPCDMMCLVPMAIDQAPYFRMARDVSQDLLCQKPAVIHSEFLPGLKQSSGKMSSTATNAETSTLFLDMKPDEVEKIIKRNAFSGGKDSLEEHRKSGGDIKIDIPYQYLSYFVEDDEELRKIAKAYSDGDMTSSEIKSLAANIVSEVIRNHQQKKSEITDADVTEFFNWDRTLDIGGCFDRVDPEHFESYTDYDNYGINFDRTFGMIQKCKRQAEQ